MTISHRGASYQIGRGQRCFGIWANDAAGAEPVERWPETDDGWTAAWSRFCELEAPGSIAAVSGPAGVAVSTRAVAAAAALGVGVASGIAGLFPGYLGGASLASQADQLVPHLIYLAAWTASGVLILLGGTRRRVGALIGVGVSAVTLGLFLADAGTVIAAGTGTGLAGAGLALGLTSWLLCTAGVVLALSVPTARAAPARTRQVRQWAPAVTAMVAALGAAIAFAPSWDRYVLRTAAGLTQTVTAGNAFANPAPVIAGDVAVMVAVVAAAVAAGLWRPVRHGAALLAGAVIPLAAQAVSAVLQIAAGTPPSQFGLSQAQAAQLGLTIDSGFTLAFWVYCAFLVGLVLCCALLASTPAEPAAHALQPGHPGPDMSGPLPASVGPRLPAEAHSTTASAG